MPDENVTPLIDHLGQRDREALFSLYRYFQWADDMRRQYLKLLSESPIGQMKRAGVTEAQALERFRSDSQMRGLLLAMLYAFPYMSYYYGAMYVVVEGWTKRLKYRDAEIDTLLLSPFVARLERHRHGAFHFTPEYFDDRLMEFVGELDSERWLDQLHRAFARWFSYHFRLPPHEWPHGRPRGQVRH